MPRPLSSTKKKKLGAGGCDLNFGAYYLTIPQLHKSLSPFPMYLIYTLVPYLTQKAGATPPAYVAAL
jgi:hypothetical protein